MSHDGLKSLLDEMLADTNMQFAEARTRDRADDPPPEPPSTTFNDVEQLRALSEAELCKLLARATRDDVLTVLSGASDGLRRRILTSLSPETVRWLKQNLEYFDEPTRALLASGRKQLIALANRLLDEGSITLPAPPVDGGKSEAPDEIEHLGGVIAELLTLVQRDGRGALNGLVIAGAEPLLTEGLALIVDGADERALTAAMDATSAALLSAYARRLAVLREGVIALHRGEDPEAFRRRLDRIGQTEGA